MTNIVHLVWNTLDTRPCIKKNMKLGLINTRALARYLIKEYHIETNLDAVISAIRRYDFKITNNIFSNCEQILRKTVNLSTRSGLVEIALKKDIEIQRAIPNLYRYIKYEYGDVLRILQANETIRILIDMKNLENILSLFQKEKILDIQKNLAEINMHIHPEMEKTPGILSLITTELSINNINIIDTMTCSPEIIWFVKENDLLKAYQTLHNLCNQKIN